MKEIKIMCEICGQSTTHQMHAGYAPLKEYKILDHDVCASCHLKAFYALQGIIFTYIKNNP